MYITIIIIRRFDIRTLKYVHHSLDEVTFRLVRNNNRPETEKKLTVKRAFCLF